MKYILWGLEEGIQQSWCEKGKMSRTGYSSESMQQLSSEGKRKKKEPRRGTESGTIGWFRIELPCHYACA